MTKPGTPGPVDREAMEWMARYEREYELRCGIEKRFDHRISEGTLGDLITRADTLALWGPENVQLEIRRTITDLILAVQALDAKVRGIGNPS